MVHTLLDIGGVDVNGFKTLAFDLIPRIEETETDEMYRWTPLHAAAACGQENVVRALLEHGGVYVNASDVLTWTPLHHAAYNGHAGTVRAFLDCPEVEANASAIDLFESMDGVSPLHIATGRGNVDAVRSLLTCRRVDVNVVDGQGYSPLHRAIERGHIDILHLLSGFHGIYVNAKKDANAFYRKMKKMNESAS